MKSISHTRSLNGSGRPILRFLRIIALVVATLPFPTAPLLMADEFLPPSYPIDRFDLILQRDPFSSKSRPDPQSETAGWADGLAIAYVSRIAGEYRVGIVSKANRLKRTRGRYQVVRENGSANQNGIFLVSIKPNPDLRKVKVVLGKGNERTEIVYAPSSKRRKVTVGKRRLILPPEMLKRDENGHLKGH
ncbi:MAG: hypothetical protein AAF591_22770 [Verrucomicrobiota bacterium]